MKLNLKEIVENLIDNFLEAGDLAIQLNFLQSLLSSPSFT